MIANFLVMKPFLLAILFFSAVLSINAQTNWVKTGGPIGGLGYNIRINPQNPNIMFVTDIFSGVNRTIDGGRNWDASNNGITVLNGPTQDAIPVFALTIDPFNPNEIWVGTESERGIFYSSDGGESFVSRSNGIVEDQGLTIRNFKITQHGNRKTIYVSCEFDEGIQGDEFTKVKGLLYKSEDLGLTWTKLWEGGSLARWLEVFPTQSDNSEVVPRLVLATGIFDREAFNTKGEGILISEDGGANWSNSNNNLTNLFVGGMDSPEGNDELIITGTGNNVTSQNRVWGGIYKSTDGGMTWEEKLGLNKGDQVEDQFTAIQFSLSNPDVVYAANGSSIYRSNDAGENWTKQTPGNSSWGPPGIIAGVPIEMTIDGENEDVVFINNYGGGVFKSEDAGVNWVSLGNGYTGAQIHAVSISQQDHSKVASIARSGPFLSHDRGEEWNGIAFGEADFPEWYDIALNPDKDSEILLSDEHQGWILKSTDDGKNWTRMYKHPDIKDPSEQKVEDRHGLKSIVYAPSNTKVIYAGYANQGINFGPFSEESSSSIPNTGSGYDGFVGTFENSFGMVRSKEGGASGTWEVINNGLGGKLNVTDIVVHPTDENQVYITLRAGGVYKSSDGGDNWTDITNNLPERNIYSMDVSVDNFDVLYVGTRFYGVYKSTDGGNTWSRVLAPVKTVQEHGLNSLFGALAVNPNNSNMIAVSDWWTGVFISDDGGATWSLSNQGLTMRDVKDLEFSNDGKFLYGASFGKGVFRMQITNEPLLDIPQNALQFEQTEIQKNQVLNLSLTNYGNAPAQLVEFSFSNEDFSTNTSENQIAANSTISIPITFTPSVDGDINGQLIIKTNAGDYEFNLFGSGVYMDCSSSIEVTGVNSTCEGSSVVISASDGFGAYQWYKGDDLLTNETNRTLEVSDSGLYKVRGINSGDCARFSAEFEFVVNELPAKTISVDGYRLMAPDGISFQWFLNDEPIEGATTRSYEAITRGVYTVLVTSAEGCTSLSDPITATSIDSIPAEDSKLAFVFPNPSKGQFTFQFPNPGSNPHDINIVDSAGRIIWTRSDFKGETLEVNISNQFRSGIYLIRVSDKKGKVFSIRILIKD